MLSSSDKSPDAWALQAASLPVAFAQVREDPRLDLLLVRSLPQPATLVLVASGGDTLISLAQHQHKMIHAVDVNPAQIALAKFKLSLSGAWPLATILQILGHSPMRQSDRIQFLSQALERLKLTENVFGPLDWVSQVGLDHAGRYEQCFHQLRQALATGIPRSQALTQVMSHSNLVCLFGPEAAQNPLKPFHEHFLDRSQLAFQRPDAAENPFLHQMYEGRFPPGQAYDWHQSNRPPLTEVVWHCGKMLDFLVSLPPSSIDFLHLSNILDWLTPPQAELTLQACARSLKSNGLILIRQLNSSLVINELSDAIRWNPSQGTEMEQMDRSFFYPKIHVGRRK